MSEAKRKPVENMLPIGEKIAILLTSLGLKREADRSRPIGYPVPGEGQESSIKAVKPIKSQREGT